MSLKNLDLNLIRVFDALLKERSVTRAGDRIGLSQPAVSSALNRLRHLLNDQLFVRNGNEMTPTPRAEDLAEPVRVALSTLEAAFASQTVFDPATLDRSFTLMGADFFSMLLMPALSASVAPLSPGTRLRLVDSGFGEIPKMLQTGMVDIALECEPKGMPDWVSAQHLFRSCFVVVARRQNRTLAGLGLASGDTLPCDMLPRLSYAIRSIDGSVNEYEGKALRELGLADRVALALPHFQAVAMAVAGSDHIAIIPCQFAEAIAESLGLAIYRSPLDIPVSGLKMLWHTRYDGDREHLWLRDRIVEAIDKLGFDASVDRFTAPAAFRSADEPTLLEPA